MPLRARKTSSGPKSLSRSSVWDFRSLRWEVRSFSAVVKRLRASVTALLSVAEALEVSARMPDSMRVTRRSRRRVSSQVRMVGGR